MVMESCVAVCESSNTLHMHDIYADIDSGDRYARTADGMVRLSELEHFVREEICPPKQRTDSHQIAA
jgi:hypothetical protein